VSRKRQSAHHRPHNKNINISGKANRILNITLFAMLLIVLRCWHLGVIQYENRLEQSQRPQKRTILEPAKRATIRDRFNIPFAVNKVQYQAAILYSQIREIPSVVWKKDPVKEKKIRILKRREYIKDLASLLAHELNLNADRLVDLIHAKATLYGHMPYVIKEDISEGEYYKLKMLEKDWYGIHVRRYPKRHYPQGKTGANVIGYMGAINRTEYEKIIQEIHSLEEFLLSIEEGHDLDLPEGMESYNQVRKRLSDLQDKAYSINDHVGKSGIEGKFEEELRGFQGKKSYYSDARGNFLRELPGARDPLSGQRLLLTISAELQEYAEELLIKNEKIRKPRLSGLSKSITPREPWIKGGAIIAMDPVNGEVLALASNPRFDPNDFVSCGSIEEKRKKQSNIACWFETEAYLGAIWDQKRPLYREVFDHKYGIIQDERMLDWSEYLLGVVPASNSVVSNFKKHSTIYDAVEVQRLVDELMLITEPECIYHLLNTLYSDDVHKKYSGRVGAVAKDRLDIKIEKNYTAVYSLKRKLDRYFNTLPSNYDKVLFVDLCRMVVNGDLFSGELLSSAGNQNLSSYRNASAALSHVSEFTQTKAKELFHDIYFKKWREENEKSYLKEMRAIEKEEKRYAKPYLDYIDKKEKKLFNAFWSRYRWQFLSVLLQGEWMDFHPGEEINPYLEYFLMWHRELQQGAHSALPWVGAYHHLRRVMKEYDVDIAIEYLLTLRSFSELDRPLLGRYRRLKKENGVQLEKHLASGFYPTYGYGYARSHAYRQATTIGSIFKIVTAYEALIQKYNTLKDPYVSTAQLNPLTIQDQYYKVGREEFVGYHDGGKPIPRYYKGGRLPRSLSRNIGKLDILTAIERSSNPYFALLAGDVFNDSEDLGDAARAFSFGEKTGIDLPLEISGRVPDDLHENRTGLYSMSIGQHSMVVTPLQTAVMLSTIANGGNVLKPKIVHLSVGRTPNRHEEIVLRKPPYKYQESYDSIGIDFPLFTGAYSRDDQSIVQRYPTVINKELFFPDQVRRILLEGMKRVVDRSQRIAIGSLQNMYRQHPEAIRDFLSLRGQLIGKTSTAESVENIDLDIEQGTNKYNHLWFGGISFHDEDDGQNTFVFKDKYGKPELVVVVYLRYGAYGKDTIPLAAQVIKKWREIKKRHEMALNAL